MRYRYLDDFRRGISVFAIFSYGIAVLGTPQCPPPNTSRWEPNVHLRGKLIIITAFCDPFSNNKYCICFIIYKLYHCTIYLIIDYEATVTFGTD